MASKKVKLDDERIEFEYQDKVFLLTPIKVKHRDKLFELMQLEKDSPNDPKNFDKLKEIVVAHGAPSDVIEELSIRNFNILIESLSGVDKAQGK